MRSFTRLFEDHTWRSRGKNAIHATPGSTLNSLTCFIISIYLFVLFCFVLVTVLIIYC
jgi:hypothetical protein